jgi:cytochrome c oxidase assembly factor CtaG
MFGLVMISILVLITVAPPFAVMAVAKAKSRRR